MWKLSFNECFSSELRQCLRTEGLRSYLVRISHARELKEQEDRYKTWIKYKEKKRLNFLRLMKRPLITIVLYGNENETLMKQCLASIHEQSYRKFEVLEYKQGMNIADSSNGKYITFLKKEDALAKNALYEAVLSMNEQLFPDMIYSDEDSIGISVEDRFMPFFKPDWSPDTFMSFFYTGNLCLLKKEIVNDYIEIIDENINLWLYKGLLRATEENIRIVHVDQVLYHKRGSDLLDKDLYKKKLYDKTIEKTIKEEALDRRNVKGKVLLDSDTNEYRIVYYNMDFPLVSIIIPSKDNIDILFNCLHSIQTITNYKNYEIVIIDNGSKEKVRKQIEEKTKDQENIGYYYQKMEFNFSKMCNMGADKAKGEYLLFLNDDTEIIQEDWLTVLLGHASLPYIGAVGAKLVYPHNNKIQHLGITNIESGPSHKCMLQDDADNIYYGRNRLEYNYLAVTGACLMIKKTKFRKVYGFDESLKVCYNDVDLCAGLLKYGYFNVSRMDVCLYHMESVSRGLDAVDSQKMQSLTEEKKYLFQKHMEVLVPDKFYNRNLSVSKLEYTVDYLFDYENKRLVSSYKRQKNIKKEWFNECLTLTIEHSEVRIDHVYLEGWAFVTGDDNAKYELFLLLSKDNGNAVRIKTFKKYRQDLVEIFPTERNIQLSGFTCRVPLHVWKEYENNRYLLMKAKYSRQVLIRQISL